MASRRESIAHAKSYGTTSLTNQGIALGLWIQLVMGDICSPAVDVLEYHRADKGGTRNQEIGKDKVSEKLKTFQVSPLVVLVIYIRIPRNRLQKISRCSLSTVDEPTIIHDKVNSAILQSFDMLPSLAQIISQNKLRLFRLSFGAYSLELLKVFILQINEKRKILEFRKGQLQTSDVGMEAWTDGCVTPQVRLDHLPADQ